MKLLVFRALWGMSGPFEEQLEQIAAAGYEGFESFLKPDTPSPTEFAGMAEKHGLMWIMNGHVNTRAELAPMLYRLADYQPVKIGLQSGRDSMSRDEGCAFFEEALRVEQQLPIPVAHETHRGRLLFNPWDTAYYLRQFRQLKIVADYSHWVNVCERLPEDQSESLALAHGRAIHIHGRVGYEQGPQVPDPSAPEYAAQLAWHEAQWKHIVQTWRRTQPDSMTFTPEYGPPYYLHTLPHTNVPVVDQWEICLWAARRARQVLDELAAD